MATAQPSALAQLSEAQEKATICANKAIGASNPGPNRLRIKTVSPDQPHLPEGLRSQVHLLSQLLRHLPLARVYGAARGASRHAVLHLRPVAHECALA